MADPTPQQRLLSPAMDFLGDAAGGYFKNILFGLPAKAAARLASIVRPKGAPKVDTSAPADPSLAYRLGAIPADVSSGIVNSLGFSAPAAAARAAGATVPTSPAYRTGEVAGLLGSALLGPGKVVEQGARMIGPGASAAVQAGKAAFQGLGGAGLAGKLARAGLLATGRAAAAGAENAIRAGFEGATPEDIARSAATGAAWGGGASLAGSALGEIGDALKNRRLAERYAQEAQKITAGKYLAGASPLKNRQFQSALKYAAGAGAKGLGKMDAADDLLAEFADLYRARGLQAPGKLEEFGRTVSATFDEIADAAEPAVKGLKAAEFVGGLIPDDALAAIADDYTPEVAQAAREIFDARMASASGIRGTKKALGQLIDQTYAKAGRFAEDQALAGALRDIAKTARLGLDDMTFRLAGDIGTQALARGGFQSPGELRRTYLLMEALGNAEARDVGAQLAKVNTGSTTTGKLIASGLIGGLAGGGVQAGRKVEGETFPQAAARIGGSALLGAAGTAAAERLATRGLGSLYGVAKAATTAAPAVGRVAGDVAGALGALAPIVGRAGGKIAGMVEAAPRRGDIQPEMAGAEAGEALAAGDQERYQDAIKARIDQFWLTSGMETQYPGMRDAFEAMVSQATGGFNPEKSAGILYPDKAERERFLGALSVSRAMAEDLPAAAAKRGGLLGTGFLEPKEKAIERTVARQSLLGDISEAAQDGVTASDVRAVVNSILGMNVSEEKKRQLLEGALRGYGIDLDMLREVGLA